MLISNVILTVIFLSLQIFGKISANDLGLGEGGDFYHKC
jgi:hypothetical protein